MSVLEGVTLSRRRQSDDLQISCSTLASSFVIVCVLAVVAFFVFYPSMRTSMIDEAIASKGAKSMAQVEAERAPFYLICSGGVFLFAWAFIAALIEPKQKKHRTEFDFPDPAYPAHPAYAPPKKPQTINLYNLKPDAFEIYVARLIEQRGYRTERTGGKGDGGIDIKVFSPSGRYVGIVQCKRYKPGKAVPPMHLRDLAKVKDIEKVPTAFLATTGHFSEQTHAIARQLGIKLIDGNDLKSIVRERRAAEQPPPPRPQYPAPSNDPHARFRPPDDPYRLPRISEQWQAPGDRNTQGQARRPGKWDMGK